MPASYLEDRLAISDLFVRYTTALDRGDVETVVDCFTADAELESPVIGVIAGRDAIRAFAERFAAQRAGGTQFRHMITNIVTDQPSKDLIDRPGRELLKKEILKGIRQSTDVKVDEILFTDVAVQ